MIKDKRSRSTAPQVDHSETAVPEALKQAKFRSSVFSAFIIKAQVRETRNKASI